jgi:hypothetical protein
MERRGTSTAPNKDTKAIVVKEGSAQVEGGRGRIMLGEGLLV